MAATGVDSRSFENLATSEPNETLHLRGASNFLGGL